MTRQCRVESTLDQVGTLGQRRLLYENLGDRLRMVRKVIAAPTLDGQRLQKRGGILPHADDGERPISRTQPGGQYLW